MGDFGTCLYICRAFIRFLLHFLYVICLGYNLQFHDFFMLDFDIFCTFLLEYLEVLRNKCWSQRSCHLTHLCCITYSLSVHQRYAPRLPRHRCPTAVAVGLPALHSTQIRPLLGLMTALRPPRRLLVQTGHVVWGAGGYIACASGDRGQPLYGFVATCGMYTRGALFISLFLVNFR